MLTRNSILAILLLAACSPAQQKQAATAEVNLCKARAVFKIAEEVTPSLQPASSSPRAKLESAEDTFCKTLSDAG